MRRLLALILAAAAALAATEPAAEQRYDPGFDFRVLAAGRFDILYHQREEPLALRLAGFAEAVAQGIDARLGAPRGRVRVVIVDQTDVANGWATVFPYNLIEIVAAPPPPDSDIGNTDDWLRLVFAHEYTHIVHLEKSRGWIGGLRRVFGRLPLLYPNLFLPTWQIEGLATFEESLSTGMGRVRAPDFRMLLDGATAAGRFAPLDRASSAMVGWPGGATSYLYGAYFHDYLMQRYGVPKLGELAERTAGRLPYFGSGAYRDVFGRSLGELWNDFQADAAARAPRAEVADARTRLTAHGFTVSSPVFSRDGRLFYGLSTPHAFPALMELPRDGSPPRQVTTRAGGGRIAPAGDRLVFDQLEFVDNVGLQSDLYVVPMRGGPATRLTRGARAADPDVSPDGAMIVCTVQQADRRLLATMPLGAGGVTREPVPFVSEPFTEFSTPRWSPDGRWIAAVRRTLHGTSDLVLVDVATREVRLYLMGLETRFATPEWARDGRQVLFASTRDGRPFGLYALEIESGAWRRLDGTGPGAQSPALSPDGQRIVYVGYTADGYDLFELPLADATWSEAGPTSESREPIETAPPAPVAMLASSVPYTPWATLAPRFWTPYVEMDDDAVLLGGATGGMDALGRHTYAVAGGWRMPVNRAEWQADYVYSRWRPSVYASASDDAEVWRDGTLRSRQANAGILIPLRRVRWSATWLGGAHVSRAEVECDGCTGDGIRRTRSAWRTGFAVSNARTFGYSISPEQGGALSVTAEMARPAFGADGRSDSVAVDVRGYVRAWPRHGVIALRAAGASGWGDEAMRRVFTAAGAAPKPLGFRFGADAIGLMRGYAEGAIIGEHAAVVNADYRFPVAWIERGIGTVPLLLRSLHGAVFVDVGHAWNGSFDLRDVRHAFGAEASADAVVGYVLPVSLTAGVARREGGWAVFARVGRAF